MLAADGVGDFGDVDVAVGVDGYAVGGDELAGAFAFVRGAEEADAVAVEVVDIQNYSVTLPCGCCIYCRVINFLQELVICFTIHFVHGKHVFERKQASLTLLCTV